MTYLRSLFFNFLVVFFVDRAMPGIQIMYFEQVPDVGADILFALIVGLFNASITPLFVLLDIHITKLKIIFFASLVNGVSFLTIYFIAFGVQVVSVFGFLGAVLVVTAVSYTSNYLEWMHLKQD